jgi:ferredoxin-NADP reductase
MSMLRSLTREGALQDVVHVHCARDAADVIFRRELHGLDERHAGYRLHERLTGAHGRLAPAELDALCPDWRERETFVSGPGDMLNAFTEHFERHADPERLHMERFQPLLGLGEAGEGKGGTITFCKSKQQAESNGHKPILIAGEEAGLELPYGCREGICHTCVGELRSGRVRDLRNGKVYGQEGEVIRTCISAPEGPIEIDL